MRKVAVVLILLFAVAAAYYILTYEAGPASDAPVTVAPQEPAVGDPTQIRLVSWNLLNLGSSKDDQELAFMAKQLSEADLVAIQEVITSPPGAQAVARLDDALDRTGAAWDYVLSDQTSGDGSERYAYLWKPSRVRLVGQPWLEASLEAPIDREPFMARFEAVKTGQQILVASFHAVPRAKRPAGEVALLDVLHTRYENDNLLILGDFNLSESSTAFDGLKAAGYQPILIGQRTSLRMRRTDEGHLANEYDNIFYEAVPLRAGAFGVLDFTSAFPTLRDARKISDHLPVYMDVGWN